MYVHKFEEEREKLTITSKYFVLQDILKMNNLL